jgi:hypothetical protein
MARSLSLLSYERALRWATAVGFTERQVPFAAAAAVALRSGVGRSPMGFESRSRVVTKQRVMERCKTSYPGVFGDE